MEKNLNVLRVQTPHGTLVATPTGDADYPGIQIGLESKGLPGSDALLTVVEYSETEHACGFYPDRPGLMQRQKNEVPAERRSESWERDHRVTPGLQTRTYENPASDDEEQMHCTYHFGYPLPAAGAPSEPSAAAAQPGPKTPDVDRMLQLHNAMMKTCNDVETMEYALGIEYLRDGCNDDVEKAAVLVSKLREAVDEKGTNMMWQELACGLSDCLTSDYLALDIAMTMTPQELLHVAAAQALQSILDATEHEV